MSAYRNVFKILAKLLLIAQLSRPEKLLESTRVICFISALFNYGIRVFVPVEESFTTDREDLKLSVDQPITLLGLVNRVSIFRGFMSDFRDFKDFRPGFKKFRSGISAIGSRLSWISCQILVISGQI